MAATKRSGRRIGIFIAALIVAGVMGAAGARFRHQLPQRLAAWLGAAPNTLEEARKAYQRGDWQQAAVSARQLARSKPNDTEALRLYARALVRVQQDETAGRIYQHRLPQQLWEPEDYLLAGLTFVRAGNPDTALDLWEQGLRNANDLPELLDHLARLSLRMQRLDGAREAAARLARQSGWEARGSFLLGFVKGAIDDPEGAVEAIRRGLKYAPGAAGMPFSLDQVRKLLARNLLRLGRPREAREPLDALFAEAGTEVDPEACWLLSRACLQEGRARDAADLWLRSGSYRASNPLLPEPSPYVGSLRCALCHSKETKEHARTRHARTFHRGAEILSLPLPSGPLVDPDDPKVAHTFERVGDRIEVKTHARESAFKIVVEYAFGLPDRYVTMVGRDGDKKYRAARLSHFQNAQQSGWTRTFGNDPDLELAQKVRGDPVDVRDSVARCLYCHVTESRNFRDPPPESGVGPEAADAGIGCERCHGPGGNHVAAIKLDFPDRAIVNVAGQDAGVINTQCADCHIVGLRSQIESAPEDPRYVRSSAATFAVSRCYTESAGAMSCLTCHDGHRDAVKDRSFYESKCLACHGGQPALPAPAGTKDVHVPASAARQGSVCKVNPKKDCLDCHMPKIPVPDLRTSLTDHYIRVHREK
jgi:tetratricopeptide (TPR) repeat protein